MDILRISNNPQWNAALNILRNDAVSEIEVNARDGFFLKRKGRREHIPEIRFASDEEYAASIETGLVPHITSIEPFNPHGYIFEGPLRYHADGKEIRGRCHIVLPPAADVPQITIAKKSTSLSTLDAIAAGGSMPSEVLSFVKAAAAADLTIVFSGGTGAGKALHKDTVIPTPAGRSTVGELEVGDIVFDETGAPTKILRKYSPNDPKAYELTFSGGQKVKASAGHLWQVVELNRKELGGSTEKPFLTPNQAKELSKLCESNELTSVKDLSHLAGKGLIRSILLNAGLSASNLILGEAATALVVENKRREDKAANRARLNNRLDIRPRSVLTTQELYTSGLITASGRLKYAVEKLTGAVQYEAEEHLPIDPYTLGAWLGDGQSDRGAIGGIDFEVASKIEKVYPVRLHSTEKRDYQNFELNKWTFEGLAALLRQNSLLNNKHIPEVYRYASVDARKALLSGLVDTDGSVDKKGVVSYGGTRLQIVETAREIALSLGWRVNPITVKQGKYKNADGETVICKKAYNFTFRADETLELQVPRKAERLKASLGRKVTQKARYEREYIVSMDAIDDAPEDYYCFEVDSASHLFLCTESFIPTHNTTFLEAFTKELADTTRLGVAEDTPELVLVQPNTTYLHSVPWRPGMEEKNVASLSWVVAQFNRMRTDKLIIGETRGKEFADFLVAANSGMDGSLTTLHANDPVRAIEKMTNFTLKGNPSQPVRAVNIDIANAIDLVIQLAYFKQDSRYRVTAVQEITNIVNEKESASITTNKLYGYNETDDTWTKVANPTDDMRKKFRDSGIEILDIAKSQPGSTLQRSGAAETAPMNPGPGQSGGGIPRFGRPNSGGLPDRTI